MFSFKYILNGQQIFFFTKYQYKIYIYSANWCAAPYKSKVSGIF